MSNKLERFINQNIKINLNDLEDINIKKDSELYSQIINSISDKYENLVFCSANLTNLVNINVDGSVLLQIIEVEEHYYLVKDIIVLVMLQMELHYIQILDL